jgi:hypothetical protein
MSFVEIERFWQLPEAPGIVDLETLNQRVLGSSPTAPTNVSKHLVS